MIESEHSFVVHAPAKINLTLHIIGRRSDGYHELDSVMQKLDLHDSLYLQRLESPEVRLSCPNSDLPEDGSNLVFQAAVSFLQEAGISGKYGVSIVLEKNIPVAAGLGGGSSDAGTVLTALNRLFDAGVPEEKLLSLAKSLGADVPFFVNPDSAVRAKGIGERMIAVAPLFHCSVLLVNPGFPVSTAWVYKNFTLTRADKDSNLSDSRENDALDENYSQLYNDLESVTIDRYPEIETIKRVMLENGATDALMSGSGPTVFGIFHDSSGHDVQRCANELSKKYRKGVFVTRPLQEVRK